MIFAAASSTTLAVTVSAYSGVVAIGLLQHREAGEFGEVASGHDTREVRGADGGHVETLAGRGHDAPGLAATLEGERAILAHDRVAVGVRRVDRGVENNVGRGVVAHVGFLYKQSARDFP